jgi:hypothetical protein
METKLFIERWRKALSAYGTPKDFADFSVAQTISSPCADDVPFTVIIAPGYASRRQLMEKQRADADNRIGNPPRWKNDGVSCFLCDNVGQAQDIGDNALLPFSTFSDYVLMPNRYPGMVGDSLLCTKRHVDLNSNLPSDYLATAVELAEKHKFIFLRNHPRAGMSIPDHDHLQLKPEGILETPFSRIEECGLIQVPFGRETYSVSRTRFDTLAIKGKTAVDEVARLTKNLSAGNEIFTFYYAPDNFTRDAGTFYVSPHSRQDAQRRVGAGAPLFMDVRAKFATELYEDLLAVPEQFLYKKGTFNWGKFFR